MTREKIEGPESIVLMVDDDAYDRHLVGSASQEIDIAHDLRCDPGIADFSTALAEPYCAGPVSKRLSISIALPNFSQSPCSIAFWASSNCAFA